MTDPRTPQCLVTLSPEGDLQVELPAGGGIRRQVKLTRVEAGTRLLRLLTEQKRKQEEQQVSSRKLRRSRAEPDWTLIAKHPLCEIRQMLPKGKAAQRQAKLTSKTLEDLGL